MLNYQSLSRFYLSKIPIIGTLGTTSEFYSVMPIKLFCAKRKMMVYNSVTIPITY